MVEYARAALGCPYVFGAAGQECTPAYRRAVCGSKPQYADAITANCPVLAGRQAGCAGCKYAGKRAYDCRGLTREAVRAATGRPVMGAGATSQWADASNWAAKGAIAQLPERPCLLFRAKGASMAHTGIYIGGGRVIHASGHKTGVVESALGTSWTHYGIPVGMEGGGYMAQDTALRRGSTGEAVKALQQRLITLGYDLGTWGADGKFGAATETAVRKFQADNSLPVDAVWDAECQERMEERLAIVEEPVSGAEAAFLQALVGLINDRLDELKA